MIEVMAGKSAAVHGLVHDATPFRFDEENTAIDYFGKLLELGGYNYYGTERMYSGIYGCEMTASIFFGIVHYQRLRHMVSDKWQVANLDQHLMRKIYRVLHFLFLIFLFTYYTSYWIVIFIDCNSFGVFICLFVFCIF